MTDPLPGLLEGVAATVLEATDASRVTIRLDDTARAWTVDDVAAEARRSGVRSLRGQTGIAQRAAATARWIERHRRPLIQEDVRDASPRPPAALLHLYGVRAQVLAPVVIDDAMIGWMSVHDTSNPRTWTTGALAAIDAAIGEIKAHITADRRRGDMEGSK